MFRKNIVSKPSSIQVPKIISSWDDLLAGIDTLADWEARRTILRQRYLDLIRDEEKPPKPSLDIQVEESVQVEECYRRMLISYQVEADERAHAYLGIPCHLERSAPAVVALHGTTAQGGRQTAGLEGPSDKAYLDHLCRQGFVVIAPEHFVSGHRQPDAGAYETAAFYEKHPRWTAVGKFTYEHSLAVDVLLTHGEVDSDRIGVMGHSLGGQGAYYLAAYDERIKAAVCNCGAEFFRHNPTVENFARDHWYVYYPHLRPQLLEGRMPAIDIHEIIALIAPRAYLDILGLNDGNPLVQDQRVLMLLKIARLYDLCGVPENFGFYCHGQRHSVRPESRALLLKFFENHLRTDRNTPGFQAASQPQSG